MRSSRTCLQLGLWILLVAPAHAEDGSDPSASRAPVWLRLSGDYRVRYESVDDSFRAGTSGPDSLLVERLLLAARADFQRFYLGAELQDSRTQGHRAETPLGTDDSNALELIGAYVGLRADEIIESGDSLDVVAGRFTIDVGSRRFVARNAFRNTLNVFTGVQGVWKGRSGTRVQTFYTLPVDRRPLDREGLEDDERDADEESARIRFWGIDVLRENVVAGLAAELFLFGLDEEDARDIQTADRELWTPGLRVFSDPERPWSFEIEAAAQFGDARRTTAPTDVTDLERSAFFLHAHVARQLASTWSPRIVLQFDYASGDDDPTDRDDERFDTLFGVPRFDFGPTGIYGAFARSNLQSPGVRLELRPSDSLNGFIGYRANFLADKTDTFTTAGVRDVSGSAGSFIGHQLEARLRKSLVNGMLSIEAGGAYLADGRFLREAPNATRDGGVLYGYLQITVSIR